MKLTLAVDGDGLYYSHLDGNGNPEGVHRTVLSPIIGHSVNQKRPAFTRIHAENRLVADPVYRRSVIGLKSPATNLPSPAPGERVSGREK